MDRETETDREKEERDRDRQREDRDTERDRQRGREETQSQGGLWKVKGVPLVVFYKNSKERKGLTWLVQGLEM